MKITGTQIRKGTTVILKGEPYKVIEYDHRTPGNYTPIIIAKLKNLISGATAELRFRPTEQIEKAEMDKQEMEYIYDEGDALIFMNTETFEQMPISKEFLGDSVYFLFPNMKVEAEIFNGKLIGISLPKISRLKVTETEPGLKGATAARQTKPATLETGLKIQVPTFIDEGEYINVDTETLEYLSRAKE